VGWYRASAPGRTNPARIVGPVGGYVPALPIVQTRPKIIHVLYTSPLHDVATEDFPLVVYHLRQARSGLGAGTGVGAHLGNSANQSQNQQHRQQRLSAA